MEIHEAVELIAYFHFDAKIEQGSKFEVEMCEAVIDQIKNKSDISNKDIALCWIYFNAHAREPLGQFIKVIKFTLIIHFNNFKTVFYESIIQPIVSLDNNLWQFDQFDFKDVVTFLLLIHKPANNENQLELKKLISNQFENDSDMKLWAMDFFDKVC